jgi:hypothetical protein
VLWDVGSTGQCRSASGEGAWAIDGVNGYATYTSRRPTVAGDGGARDTISERLEPTWWWEQARMLSLVCLPSPTAIRPYLILLSCALLLLD